jgi:alpha-D-ribose 1-methylphosphonate 5-triphosphate diphosphatase
METAQDAASAGDDIIFGAPNVVRGGSHLGWTNAAEMVARGLCSILASDYYYPAPLLAAFRLAATGVTPLERAWSLVSSAPAQSMGLGDRGTIVAGKRADLILVDASDPSRPRVAAAIVAGRPVYLTAAVSVRS